MLIHNNRCESEPIYICELTFNPLYLQDPEMWREYDVDGYIIVYSITDRRSYQKAIDLLNDIRRHRGPITTVILVANKSDLERARMVGKQGTGKQHSCKKRENKSCLDDIYAQRLLK